MEKKYKIGVLCQYAFPVGMAPTTRIISYSTGLVQNGASVEVFSYIWRSDESSEPLEGTIRGLKYKIPCRYHSKKGKIYHVLVDKPNIYRGTIKGIKQSHNEIPFDCFLISLDKISDYRYFLPKLARLKIPMVLIADEYPEPIRQLKSDIPYWDVIRYKFYHQFFRKRILMTKFLEDFYNREISFKPSFILSSVLDETRFEGITRQPVERQYLCYMGNMMIKKDNVDNIVNAFSLIAADFPEYDVYLYGTPNAHDEQFVKNCIMQNKMENRIFIKGRLDYSAVPQTLANATVLLASQPNTKRAEGGFPTKMGEYMMSHTPMLVTDVGEIKQYVQDGVNTYMVAPENPEAYAKKLRYILTHPDDAKRVADNAYAYAIKHFTAKEATKSLLDFLKS